MKKLRLRILKLYPTLKDTTELRMFLTKGGDISDVRKMSKADYE